MRKFLFFILSIRVLFSYSDPELETLWKSLSNINDPTVEDYRLIESYLLHGNRPYLNSLQSNHIRYGLPRDFLDKRIKQRRSFKLVGPNGEMPVFELHKLEVTEKTKDRCILIYASYNPPYPQKAYSLLQELRGCGYSGNVMIRIGGFPNLSEGGLKFCPYFGVWKNEFIKEALKMGFTKILHLDTSIHPMSDLSSVFNAIDSLGYYLLGQEGAHNFFPYLCYHQHLDYLKMPSNWRSQETVNIPWSPGYVIGFDFTNKKAAQLFYDWDFATKDLERFNFFGSEEVIMTLLTWERNFSPTGWFHDCVIKSNYCQDPNSSQRPTEFYFDTLRN